MHLIIDAEMDEVIHTFFDPMVEIAGMSPNNFRVIILNSPVINASAIAGNILALNTGFLLKVRTVEELLGVLAHETGHFMGGHHARHEHAVTRSTGTMIAGALLGGLATALGKPDVGLAAMFGGQQLAIRSYLEHRRSEESSADQTAVNILDHLNISSAGLASFMKVLADQNIAAFSKQDAYLMTHPLSHERFSFFSHHLSVSDHRDGRAPQHWIEIWAKAQAKLKAFFGEPEQIIRIVGNSQTTPDLYALAIAHYRKYDLAKAQALAHTLIEREPQNPYFHELVGQILFETGQVKASLPAYKKALSLRPKSQILQMQTAHVMIEEGHQESLAQAEKLLGILLETDNKNLMAWHFLAVAQGKQQKEGLASLSLAEKSLLLNDKRIAEAQARKAITLLPPKTPHWQRAQDILDSFGANGALDKKYNGN